MRKTLGVLALGLTLLAAACGGDPEPGAAPPSAAATSASPAAPSTAPTAGGDIAAACTAADKADDDLFATLETLGTRAVDAGRVQATLVAYQKNAELLAEAATKTGDAKVKPALEALAKARGDIAASLKTVGTDKKKLIAATNTAADLQATVAMWRYPDGLCGEYAG
ncbi:hypothetical protein AB0B66_36490 [Catellatospora sp. NPDC049111]|uniref:hypothetical protein n=1 Tax=Catellatospora sp. NPDC049111 TaxID=3155271 RepID=UPI0033EFBBCC